LEDANTNYANSLKSEVEKLTELNFFKTGEMKNLYEQLQVLKYTNHKEMETLNTLND
jgi:hypothetical protein